MKQSKQIVIATLIAFYGMAAAADQQCQSTVQVNGKTYTSDKCNVSIVNGQVSFSDTPPAIPALPSSPSGLPASLQNLLKGLY
jgi:hypothetical protein